MSKILYISNKDAEQTHLNTIKHSGGGDTGILHIGYLYSALEFIQNDDYYPTFEDKLVHLVWSINRNHSFCDGNKRLSITLGTQFLLLNGYMFCAKRFMVEMENISYHLAAGTISKELLQKIIHSFLEGEIDFDESLKLEIFMAISEQNVGFDE